MFKKRSKLIQIGETVAIDPAEITAIYCKGKTLVVRISGIGVIELEEYQLFHNIQKTFVTLATARNKT